MVGFLVVVVDISLRRMVIVSKGSGSFLFFFHLLRRHLVSWWDPKRFYFCNKLFPERHLIQIVFAHIEELQTV